MKASSRLKNFCELCRKLCRDENGYICHLNSVSHQKRVEQFKTNPQQMIDKYSEEMQRKFIQILKSKYPGQSKHLQVVYNEYEQQSKRFIKFSNTRWKNLKEFGEYLATGQVKNIKITGVPPDCYITYTVNKTMQFIEKNKKQHLEILKQKQKELFEKSLQNRIQRQKAQQEREAKKFEEQMRKIEEQKNDLVIPDKLEFNFQNWGDSGKRNAFISNEQLEKQTLRQQNENQQALVNKKLENSQKLMSKIASKQGKEHQHVKSQSKVQAEQVDEEQVEWIMPGIIVKVKPHDIDSVFLNKKTRIIQIVQPYVAKVQIGTATLEIDQTYLQTVIPKINHQVMILNGDQKGRKGFLTEVDLTGGFGQIQVEGKSFRIPFNYFSKFQQDQSQK